MSGYLRDAGVDVNQTRTAYGELQQLNAKYGELATDVTLAAGGALPPPAGTAADLASLGRSLWKGNWGDALFNVVGLVPLGGDAVKAGRIANKLNDFRRTLDVAQTGMTRAFNKIKEAAGKYWEYIVQGNQKKWRDALSNCGGTQACKDVAALQKGPQYRNTPTSDRGSWNPPEGRGDGVFTPNNGSPPITYKNGFPDYSSFSRGDVEIPMRGNRSSDFTNADKAMREKHGADWERPSDYTWHHKEDGVTMQLVPKNVHSTGAGAQSPHMGGASMYGNGSQASGF